MASRGKSGNHTEVATARVRLDATLQHLVEKKDDSSQLYESDFPIDVINSEPSSVPSPRKQISLLPSKTNRKRKRKDEDGTYHSSSQNVYVMKLFDRSVDLAQFDEATPLYPICRAWMKNKPHIKEDLKRSPSPVPEDTNNSASDDEYDSQPDIYKLPSPIKCDPSDTKDYRIPETIPEIDERLDIHADPENAPSPEQLLINHMVRWKQVRESWRTASIQNEMRYVHSMTVLRDMFERQMREAQYCDT